MQRWLVPIVLSAVALGLYDIFRKRAVQNNAVLEVLLFSTAAGAAMFLVLMGLFGDLSTVIHCSRSQYILLVGKSLLVGSSWVCVYQAMRKMPITIAAPIRATSPLWTVFGGMMLYNEIPSGVRALGMLLIFTGYYLFSVIGKLEGFSLRHRDMHLIIAGTLLGSASALYDKYLLNVLAIPPQTVQFYFALNLVVLFSLTLLIVRATRRDRCRFEWRWSIPVTGMLLILSDFLYFYALSLPDVHISVLSLFRRCSCVITFIVGAYVFHDINMRRKAYALLVILAGAVIIALNK